MGSGIALQAYYKKAGPVHQKSSRNHKLQERCVAIPYLPATMLMKNCVPLQVSTSSDQDDDGIDLSSLLY
jgi:hypothetical protein